MSHSWLPDFSRLKKPKPQGEKLESLNDGFVYGLPKILLPVILVILLSEVINNYTPVRYNVVVILLLGTVIYTALRTGMMLGFIGSIIIVMYNFYLITDTTGLYWLSSQNLQRGAVIAIAFPSLAIIVGRLKDRNDFLLRREKAARIKAEESAQQLRFMAEAMPQKIFTNFPDGTSEYTNPQWQEYTGDIANVTEDEGWSSLIHPNDREENVQQWRHSLETGEPFQFEHRLRRKDGEYRWHLTRALALRNDKGKVIKWIGSSTDIEDVRRTRKLEADTARLIRQRTQLMELNTAKDEFISLASHQLRTPATGVKQYINMVLDGYAGDITDKVRTFLAKANESNERQLAVINDLLRVAQVDAGKVVLRKEEINVGELITSVISEQGSKFSKRNQTIRFDKPAKNLTATADATKLRMVIENILDNAGKYSQPGSNITVRLRYSRGFIKIAIIDEGVGIAQKDVAKVFQKFLRLDNPMSTEVGGTGLGLYWVQKIIDLHGGCVDVTSRIGKGTAFVISLPVPPKRASRK